jgi:hypothetical protein
MGLDVGPLAAVTVAGLEGGELLVVGMVGGKAVPLLRSGGGSWSGATPSSGDRVP